MKFFKFHRELKYDMFLIIRKKLQNHKGLKLP